MPNQVDHVFRHHASRVVAALARRFGLDRLDDIEDAVQDAFVAALRRWPHHGTPDNPAGWLVQVAKNRLLDRIRRRERWEVEVGDDDREADSNDGLEDSVCFERELSDDQLRMVFACCHPAVPRDGQLALTLKTVCGLSTAEIARGLLTSQEATAKILTRAKRRMRDAEVRFEIPAPSELEDRLDSVFAVVYLTFNEGYSAFEGESLVRSDLVGEAVRLAELLADNPVTGLPRAHALAALLLFQSARSGARTDPGGDLILLSEQDRTRWDSSLVRRGLYRLGRSASGSEVSAYHLEAEIASCHATAESFESTDWPRVLSCYDELVARTASPVVEVNRLVAVAHVAGPGAALAALDLVGEHRALQGYYPYFVTRGMLLERLGDAGQAAASYRRAQDLTASLPVRRFLERKLDGLDAKEARAPSIIPV